MFIVLELLCMDISRTLEKCMHAIPQEAATELDSSPVHEADCGVQTNMK